MWPILLLLLLAKSGFAAEPGLATKPGASEPPAHSGAQIISPLTTATAPITPSDKGAATAQKNASDGLVSVPPPPDLPLPTNPSNQDLLPILIAPPPAPAPLPANPQLGGIQSASEVIKIVLGLVFLFGLAYLAGTWRIQALERRLQVTNVVTAGLPFVFLGVIAHTQGVGILSESVLWQLRPLLALGLGWVGFTTGFRFDSKLGDSLMPGTNTVSLITASVPFATIVATCALLLVLVEHSPANAIFLRDAMMLGTAGAMTAYNAPRLFQDRASQRPHIDRVASIVTLEQLAGIIGLLVVAAYFRPQDNSVAWHLPGTAWLFITIGMGTMIGGVVWGMLAKVKAGPEFMVLILGSICFAAGMASFLRLSPLVVCFIVGLILVNLPGTSKDRIRESLEHMERPIYLLFLVVAGSLWHITRWQGWALMLLFVPARLLGKWLAVRLCAKNNLSPEEQRSLVFSPMGALSIAIIVNAQDLYFGATISWMVTAVIGGAMVTEIVVQIASLRNALERQSLQSAA